MRTKEQIKSDAGLPLDKANAHAEMILILEQIRDELVKLNAK